LTVIVAAGDGASRLAELPRSKEGAGRVGGEAAPEFGYQNAGDHACDMEIAFYSASAA
jgi:hypothetical protein